MIPVCHRLVFLPSTHLGFALAWPRVKQAVDLQPWFLFGFNILGLEGYKKEPYKPILLDFGLSAKIHNLKTKQTKAHYWEINFFWLQDKIGKVGCDLCCTTWKDCHPSLEVQFLTVIWKKVMLDPLEMTPLTCRATGKNILVVHSHWSPRICSSWLLLLCLGINL